MTRVSKGLKATYPIENMIGAVEAVRAGSSVREAAAKYGVPKSTLGDRISGRIDVEARPGRAPVIPKDIEDAMVSKAMSRADQGFGLSKRTMIARAGTLCKTMGFRNNFTNGVPGKAWWAGLKSRHPALTLRRPEKLSTTRSRAMNPTVVGAYFKDLHFEVASLPPTSIWNMDETNMCLEHKPANVVARKGAKTVPGRTSNSRETVTFLPCINAAGQKMPPLIIVKGKTSRSLRSYNVHEGPDGALWTYQKKAYMTDEIGAQWFCEIFLKNCGDIRPQILIMDNHHSHESLSLLEAASDNNIKVLSFPPNTTHYLCPLDRAVFGPFQRAYDSVCSEFTTSCVNAIVNKLTFPKLLNEAYVQSFTRVNIVAGFQSTGICDWDPLAIPVKGFSSSVPFDKKKDQVVEEHPLQWVIRETTATTVSGEPSVQPQASTSSADDSLVSLEPQVPISSADDSLLNICPDVIDQEGNVVAHLIIENNLNPISPSNDPVMPSVISDEDFEAASVLVALNDSSDTLSCNWNSDIDALFGVGTPEVKVSETKSNPKRVTSHRLLTSKEVIQEKREEQLKKELKAKQMDDRKRKQEQKYKLKLEKEFAKKQKTE